MSPNRLEAFSDGVMAIIITIMVLGLQVPEEPTLQSLSSVVPVLLSYLISFIYVGIYWNNHHHLFHATEKINGKILWANLHLLFWLSFIPFTTAWIDKDYEATLPLAAYGFVLLMSALAYLIIQSELVKNQENAELKKAIGKDWKGKISLILYVAGIGLSFINNWFSMACYVVVAVFWVIPDKRIEERVKK